jgi:transcriptional regulator with XRE-family HTH domain
MTQQPESKKQLIARRIREARKLAGVSQGQVAKMLGLHRPSISEAEAGNRNVTAEELARLAEIYKVSVSWLAGEGAESSDPHDDRVQLAARELKKLKPADLERLLAILATMRSQGGEK